MCSNFDLWFSENCGKYEWMWHLTQICHRFAMSENPFFRPVNAWGLQCLQMELWNEGKSILLTTSGACVFLVSGMGRILFLHIFFSFIFLIAHQHTPLKITIVHQKPLFSFLEKGGVKLVLHTENLQESHQKDYKHKSPRSPPWLWFVYPCFIIPFNLFHIPFNTDNQVDRKIFIKLTQSDLMDLYPSDFSARKKFRDFLSELVGF